MQEKYSFLLKKIRWHTWDDLTEVLSEVIDDPVAQNEVVHNFRKVFLEEYTLEKFVLYWYNIIKEQPEVV